tara:strand:+ start:14100 stop:14729 length:630 start_codon:yes stop_codon:yes gene_type:complete
MANISGQFNALPIKDLIAGPLTAAAEAQTLLASASANFIKDVGLQEDATTKELTARTVDFSFNQPTTDAAGNVVQEKVDLKVPLLAIINTPSLSVKEAEVRFTMSVSSSESSESGKSSTAAMSGSASANFGFYKAKVSMSGSVASHSTNTRKSDNSAKYDVKVIARDDGPPEGLSQLLDILQGAIKPASNPVVTTPAAATPAAPVTPGT